MRLRKDSRLYIESAIRHSTYLDGIDFLSNIAMLVFYSILVCKGAWYLIAVIFIADTFRFILRGAWYRAPSHLTAHWHNPSKDINAIFTSCLKITFIAIFAIIGISKNLLRRAPVFIEHTFAWMWYLIVIATIIETFRCLLHTLHKFDSNWLNGTKGSIGFPNWISISRIALSVVMPHIYIYRSFGEQSNIIATILMVVAISTDAIDGCIARHTHSVTKVGKYLDPLSDKVIFFPNAVAFTWLLYRDYENTGKCSLLVASAILMAVAIARDILFFYWFFTRGNKIPSGIGASFIDKIRMASICAWLLSTSITITIKDSYIQRYMPFLSICLLAIVAILSIVSIRTDSERLKESLKNQSSSL